MQTICTVTRGKKTARIVEQDGIYSVLATMNNAETFSRFFVGKTWKRKASALKRIEEGFAL